MAKQTYRVTGEQPVVPPGSDDQFVKGDEFTADLDEQLERALVEAGAIQPVRKSDKPKEG